MFTISLLAPRSKAVFRSVEKAQAISTTGKIRGLFFSNNPRALKFSNGHLDKNNLSFITRSLTTFTDFTLKEFDVNITCQTLNENAERPIAAFSSKNNTEEDRFILDTTMHVNAVVGKHKLFTNDFERFQILANSCSHYEFRKESAERVCLLPRIWLNIPNDDRHLIEAIFDPTKYDFNLFKFMNNYERLCSFKISGNVGLISKKATALPALWEGDNTVVHEVVKSPLGNYECLLTSSQIEKERSQDRMLIHLFNSNCFKAVFQGNTHMGVTRTLIKSTF